MKIITPYSTYLLSKYSEKVKVKVSCEYCKNRFFTNIDRKRCSPECAKKARKQNSKRIKN
jgi:hypothetical protein